MKINVRTIFFKLWLYFILFAAVILLMLWFLQTVFLGYFYKTMKIDGIARIANTITAQYGQDGFESTIDQLTFKNSLLVYVTDVNGNIIYSSDEHGFRSATVKNPQAPGVFPSFGNTARPLPWYYSEFLTKIAESTENHIVYTLQHDRFNGQTLVYGVKLSDAVLYISTPLDPVDSTTGILRTQLIYVTMIALLLGFIISFFIARKFAKPISKITSTARQLATGNYNVLFEKGYYSEIDELAEALNHTAKELSKVEKLRRDLIANISHELRTPLTMIKAYSEMIRDISGHDKAKREANLNVIIDETDRLSLLVNDILTLSVMQSGNEVPNRDNINLSFTVKRVLSRFELLSEHDGYIIKARIDHDVYVLADEPRLEQVFYNLIGNAINHIGDDKLIMVHLIDLGGKVRFEVKDKGNGIPEEDQLLIWDRYYRSEEHTRSVVGTGLGLSIVKNILELHGAEFGVQSDPGQGSMFWFELNK